MANSFQGVLASIPGLGGYLAGEQNDQDLQRGQLQQLGVLSQLQGQAQARQQQQAALMEQQQLKGVLSQAGGNPERAIGALLSAGTPQSIELAAKLKAFMPKAPEPFTLSPGAQRYGADGKLIAEVPNRPMREQNPSNLSRLIEERAALPENDPRRIHYDNAIEKESKTAKQISPTIVMPRDNKAPMGFRFTASGDLERIPGGPADLKAEAEVQKKVAGVGDVDIALGTLRDAYDRLEQGGGITSTQNSGPGNLVPAISSSGIGQFAGKMLGTSNQSARNDIAMARPSLLAALMKATGMSAKQMDSNAELKLWLSTATDPTLDVESNRRALANIERKYLGNAGKSTPEPAAGGIPAMSDIDAEIARRRGRK